jgi:hypothetical protein
MGTFYPTTVRFAPVTLFRRSSQPALVPVMSEAKDSGLLLQGLRILQLGFGRTDGLLLSETMQRLGARNVARSDQVSPLGLGKPGSLRYDGIVVNLDRFGDVDMGIDRLLRYRRACPTSFVVIATADVASDDFGHHRRAICDSTLRLPLTASRLTEALRAALENHLNAAA